MENVTFDAALASRFMSDQEVALIKGQAEAARAELLGRQGAGNDFLGWIDFPVA